MSRISVECPECHGVFDVKAFRAGHRVACKLCSSVVRVPTETATPAVVPDEDLTNSHREPRPLLRRMSFSTAESDTSDAIYNDIFDDTAEVSARSGGSSPLPFKVTPTLVMRVGVGLFVLLAVYVAYQAGRGRAVVAPHPNPVVPAAPQ
jgi:hypothetical protein